MEIDTAKALHVLWLGVGAVTCWTIFVFVRGLASQDRQPAGKGADRATTRQWETARNDPRIAEAIAKFGLPADPARRGEIIQWIERECEPGERAQRLLKLLCAQLFSIGEVEDSRLIWLAKRHASLDDSTAVDIESVCGAGVEETKRYLRSLDDPEFEFAARYIEECERDGPLAAFSAQVFLDQMRALFPA